MSFDPKTIKKVAKLARLRLSDEETAHYAKEMQQLLSFVEDLQKVNTDNVPPMAGVGNFTLRFREDNVTDGNIQQDVLKNAPDAQYGCFAVPKVIE